MDDWMDAGWEPSLEVMDEENDLRAQKLSKADDHSSAIASKLLQGWTLLGEHCPVCVTPLVRNREKQKYCVACSQWVLTEEQLAAKLNEQRDHDSQLLSETSAPSASPVETPSSASGTASQGMPSQIARGRANGSHLRVPSFRDEDQDGDERSPKRLASTEFLFRRGSGVGVGSEVLNRNQDGATIARTPVGLSKQTGITLPKVHVPVNSTAVLSSTLSTLFQKLEELRLATAVCQDVQELTQLLRALGDCMHTIQYVTTLSK